MDKIDRLLDAMEHPGRYTTAEMETMLRDPEIRETLDLLARTKSSLVNPGTPDVEEEWKRFERKHGDIGESYGVRTAGRFPRSVAAVVVGIISLTAVGAMVGVGIHTFRNRETPGPGSEDIARGAVTFRHADTVRSIGVRDGMTREPVVFDNETLENVITRIAAYYDCQVVFESEAAKSLRLYFRWDPAMRVEEVVESLDNFGRIHLELRGTVITVIKVD
ncbi:MAG: DUF4974 domain-containing protein [Bacteroides sp.]|nr:DUF4974 domain-containing protein [Bacteroides sp.]